MLIFYIQVMNQSKLYQRVLSQLKITDSELKESLNNCSDNSQVIDILNRIESKLDEQLESLENHVDGQKLLDELHRYNDIKDMTQVLIGSLSIIRGVTAAQLHKDYNLESN